MRITFFFTTAIFTKVSYVHLSFPKVAGVKTIVYLKLRSPDAQPNDKDETEVGAAIAAGSDTEKET